MFSRFLLILVIMVAWSCRTTDSESDLDRVKYQDASSKDIGPGKKFENWTEARLQALAEYGEQLLAATQDADDIQNQTNQRIREIYNLKKGDEAAFARLQVEKLKDVYTITPRRGSQCFSEEGDGRDLFYGGGATSVFVDSLTGPKKQVEAIAEFLGEYHALMGGKNSGIATIQRVEFCPDSVWKFKMAYKGGVLSIGLPHHTLSYGFYNSQQIMQMWDSGEFLQSSLPPDVAKSAKTQIGMLWSLINPIGAFRIALRRGLLDRSVELAERIRGWLNRKATVAGMMPELQGLVYEQILSAENRARLADLEKAGKSADLLRNWSCIANQPSSLNHVSAIAQAAICKAKQRNTTVKYDLKATLVNVANIHQIDVCAAFQVGTFDDRFLNQQPVQIVRENEEFRYEVNATGVVNVVTGDLINVTALMDIGHHATAKTLESLTFDRAIAATLNGQQVCP
jgi:hypothetical protein